MTCVKWPVPLCLFWCTQCPFYVQISPVAEVQAPSKDDKEGGLPNKDVTANATEVGMGTSDPVIVPSHLS